MKQTAGIPISLTPKPLREVEDYPCVQQKYYVGVAEQTDISNTKPRFGWKTANLKNGQEEFGACAPSSAPTVAWQ